MNRYNFIILIFLIFNNNSSFGQEVTTNNDTTQLKELFFAVLFERPKITSDAEFSYDPIYFRLRPDFVIQSNYDPYQFYLKNGVGKYILDESKFNIIQNNTFSKCLSNKSRFSIFIYKIECSDFKMENIDSTHYWFNNKRESFIPFENIDVINETKVSLISIFYSNFDYKSSNYTALTMDFEEKYLWLRDYW
jgi:hypothetical protein